jgi:hypothetical protein
MFHQENLVLIAMIVVQFGNRQMSDAAGAPHPGTRLPAYFPHIARCFSPN